MLALGHEAVSFVSLGPVALVLLLRVFFVKNLLSSWYLGVGVALALTLARTLVPWFLAPFYRVCSGGAGPGLPGPAGLDRSLLQSWCLVLGPGFLVCRLPSSPSHGLARLVGLCMSPLFEMVSVLFHGNIGSHFWGISRSVFGSV